MTSKAERGRPQEAQIKIRNYLINLIFHQKEGQVEKLPPYDELAGKLGVARSSLQIAVKQLVTEGYLVTKPGIGTFSSPDHRLNPPTYASPDKLIGLILEDGKAVYRQYFAWSLLSWVGEAFTKRCLIVRELLLGSYNDDAIMDEILSAGLDGLVWLQPRPERFGMIRSLGEKLPVMTTNTSYPGTHSVCFDNYAQGCMQAKALLERGKTTPAISPTFSQLPEKVEGMKHVFAEQGIPLDEQFIYRDRQNFPMEFARDLKAGARPDSISFNPEETRFILSCLEQYGVSVPEECLPVVTGFRPTGIKTPMLVLDLNMDLLAETIAERLLGLMAGAKPEPDTLFIQPTQKFVE